MRIGSYDTEEKVLIVAEIGNNHEGNVSVAKELIEAAASAGVDAVKFQTYRTELYVSSCDAARFARLKSFELSFDEFQALAACASSHGVEFLSTPFDLESAAFLNSIVPAFKISSSDNTFGPLLACVAGFGKPIILSTGLAGEPELRDAVRIINDAFPGACGAGDLALLHCVAQYPVDQDSVNLNRIGSLRDVFGYTVGYSDHTLGVSAAPLAVACGARIIEKHFTLDKNQSDFRDHQLSADPREMAALVQEIRRVEILLGNDRILPSDKERGSLGALRRSIVATHPIKAGSVLLLEDITWVRPGGGICPGKEKSVLGRKLLRDVSQDEKILPEMLEVVR